MRFLTLLWAAVLAAPLTTPLAAQVPPPWYRAFARLEAAGAHLRITSLRGPMGPGIEFLEYVQPRDGRPFPADERASDLIHWQTRILVPDAAAASARLRSEGAQFISPGVVALVPGVVTEGTAGIQVRDPDRHVVQLIEP